MVSAAGHRATLLGVLLAIAVHAPIRAAAVETREYDGIGRLRRVIFASGGMIEHAYDGRGNILSIVRSLDATGVGPRAEAALAGFALGSARPNPGSGAVRPTFSLLVGARATLQAFDIAGRVVAILADGTYAAGVHVVELNASRWAGGVYLLRLEAGGLSATRRVAIAL